MTEEFTDFNELQAVVTGVTKQEPKGLTPHYTPEDMKPTFRVEFFAAREEKKYTLHESAFKRLFPAGAASAIGTSFFIRVCNRDCPLKLYCLSGMRVGTKSFTREPDCQL